ncbi:hypothetical protein L1987_05166 [Smallanthus sonchifolius]|uniref:Uncharacterized protein n=1 Tax=Smallanthus sonchifolius TaxID=185202 RepID=A0ACB9JUK0_9ASTR|nr:hypothetical protein L1987_05166 [Smallanthus sonchifolius]
MGITLHDDKEDKELFKSWCRIALNSAIVVRLVKQATEEKPPAIVRLHFPFPEHKSIHKVDSLLSTTSYEFKKAIADARFMPEGPELIKKLSVQECEKHVSEENLENRELLRHLYDEDTTSFNLSVVDVSKLQSVWTLDDWSLRETERAEAQGCWPIADFR